MFSLITEHLDIWTAAQTQRTNGGRGRGKNSNGQSPHGIKKLRELILELAVRGKLVPQDPNDEPASVLLEKIAKEKARLIKEGKIKKQKKLPEISEDGKPFELPGIWEWVRLGATGLGSTGKTPSTRNPKYYDGVIPFLGPGQITLEGDITDSDKSLTEEGCEYSVIAESGDILMVCIGGSIGKSAIARSKVAFNQQINCIRPLYVDSTYLNAAINTPHFQTSLLDAATGSATPIINRSKWEKLLVALPPLAEQNRIVAKVVELMALCDHLEQQQTGSNATHQTLVQTLLTTLTTTTDQAEFTDAWERIASHFDTLFTTEHSIDQLKQTILQLAVMGKLVPQDPNDEPASMLLEKIAKEKGRLIKEGKIKKQKTLPEITENEKPFDLQKGWEWSRMGVLGHTQTGTTPSTTKSEYFGKGYPFIKPADITDKGVFYDGDELTEAGIAAGRLIPDGSALMVCIGGSIGKVGYTDRVASCNQQINAITPFGRIDAVFIAYWMKSPLIQQQVLSLAPQTTLPILSKGKWELLLFPLPPLAEQQRIVAKVDELMALCDTLKAWLNDAQTTRVHLADAIVEQAVV